MRGNECWTDFKPSLKVDQSPTCSLVVQTRVLLFNSWLKVYDNLPIPTSAMISLVQLQIPSMWLSEDYNWPEYFRHCFDRLCLKMFFFFFSPFRSLFRACMSSDNLNLCSSCHCSDLFNTIEHMHLSGSHITFRAVNTKPIHMFDTVFPSLFTLDMYYW